MREREEHILKFPFKSDCIDNWDETLIKLTGTALEYVVKTYFVYDYYFCPDFCQILRVLEACNCVPREHDRVNLKQLFEGLEVNPANSKKIIV